MRNKIIILISLIAIIIVATLNCKTYKAHFIIKNQGDCITDIIYAETSEQKIAIQEIPPNLSSGYFDIELGDETDDIKIDGKFQLPCRDDEDKSSGLTIKGKKEAKKHKIVYLHIQSDGSVK